MLPSLGTSPTKRKYLFDSVFSQTQISTQYLLQLIFSTIITVLGLLTGNSVVVIGAMLISPLFWPVMGIALGIISSRQNILKNSTISFVISTAIVIFVSFLITFLVPISDLSSEITSRLNPNIIDLFIALSTSIIGVLALYYPTISATATGVAISISLLPALSIVGIGLSRGLTDVLVKSSLLYITNVGAIIFMGVLTLYFLNIRPRKEEEEKRFKFGILFSGILMVLLSLPLTIFLQDSIRQSALTSNVRRVLTDEILEISPEAEIASVDIDVFSIRGTSPLNVEAVIYLPENNFVTKKKRDQIIKSMSEVANSEVNLRLNVLSKLSLQTEDELADALLRQEIRNIINLEFENYYPEAEISSIQVEVLNTQTEPEKEDIYALVTLKRIGNPNVDITKIPLIEDFISNKLDINLNLDAEVLKVLSLNNTEEFKKEAIVRRFSALDEIEAVLLNDIDVSETTVSLRFFAPYNTELDYDFIRSQIVDLLQKEYDVNVDLIRYDSR